MLLIDGHLNRWRETLMWQEKEMKLKNKHEYVRRCGLNRLPEKAK